jgi:hypothetical protein
MTRRIHLWSEEPCRRDDQIEVLKADEIGDWDVARRHLRICWEGKHLDRNCGACMRCVSTALYFAALD